MNLYFTLCLRHCAQEDTKMKADAVCSEFGVDRLKILIDRITPLLAICECPSANALSFFDTLFKFGVLLEFNLFRGLRLALRCASLKATMLEADSISELQSQLTHLERHIAEQDAEFYQLVKRLDALSQLVQLQKTQINTLSSGGQAGAEEMPANEKPPHY